MVEKLGARLRYLRKTAKISQKELAEALGVTKGQISQYENGHSSPSVEVLVNMSAFFNRSTDYLLGNPLRNRSVVEVDVENLSPDQVKLLQEMIRLFKSGFEA